MDPASLAIGLYGSLLQAVQTTAHGWRKLGEFRRFNADAPAILLQFGFNKVRLELVCSRLGYQINSDGVFSKLPEDQFVKLEIREIYDNPVAVNFITGRLSMIGSTLEKVAAELDSLSGGQGSATQKLDEFLNQQHAGNQSTARDSNDRSHKDFLQYLANKKVLKYPFAVGKVKRARNVLDDTLSKLERHLDSINQGTDALEALVIRETTQLAAGQITRLQTTFSDMCSLAAVSLRAPGMTSLHVAAVNSIPTFPHIRSQIEEDPDLTISPIVLQSEQHPEEKKRSLRKLDDGSTALIEWITEVYITSEAEKLQTRRRLGALVRILALYEPRNYRIFEVRGYVEYKDGQGMVRYFGLVYRLPDSFDLDLHSVVSLKDLLPYDDGDGNGDSSGEKCDEEDEEAYIPSLTQRFLLAKTLAKALYQFHSSRWLHEGISSDNILFVTRGEALAPSTLDEPFITGFSFSREEHTDSVLSKGEDHVMKNYYYHPLYRRPGLNRYRFRGEFDIYALGRVLLEIGVWQMRDDMSLNRGLKDLPKFSGDLFAHAVSWCLGESAQTSPIHPDKVGDIDDPRGWHSQLSNEYIQNVLFKLQYCCA